MVTTREKFRRQADRATEKAEEGGGAREDAAYGNRWRRVSPAAKAVFALAGLAAAFAAATPRAGLG